MEAKTHPLHPIPTRNVPGPADDDYDWVYEDPDLRPYLSNHRRRPEVPLTAWQ